MKGKRFGSIITHLISTIFTVVIGILAMMSVFMHCETNIYGYEKLKSIAHHTVYIYCGLVLLGVVVIMAFCILLQYLLHHIQKEEKITRIAFFFCAAIILIEGILWIFFNDSVPTSDQKIIYAEAQRIAGFSDAPFDIGYFSYFQRNRGIVLFMAAIMKMLGNSLYSFRIINLLAVCVMYYSVCKATELVFKNPIITTLAEFLLMLFYPIVIYTGYHYGTLWSVAFTSLGLYATVSWHENPQKWYAILIIFAFPLGILMHQSAAIGLVAAIVYLLLNSKKRLWIKELLICITALIMVFLFMKTVKITYEHITGADPQFSAVPVTCTIYMGLTSTTGTCGPGSQDGSYTEIFNKNHQDGEAANKEALQLILSVVKEYFTGERSLKFFLEKTEYQWLDPTFGARKIIRTNDPNMEEPPNSETYIKFYNSTFRTIIFKLSIAGMILIYVSVLISGIKTLYTKIADSAIVLMQLYVIGGFAFQLFWESLSRYCFNYFIWLFPMAGFGLYSLFLCVKRCMNYKK